MKSNHKSKTRFLLYILIISILFTVLLPYSGTFSATNEYTQELKSGIDSFPESYRPYLEELSEIYPNWTFEAYYTGIDWDELVEKETNNCDNPKNRIYKTRKDSWKDSCVTPENGASYVCASPQIIAYYMDPRNFLNEINIFEFEEVSFNPQIHTVANVNKILQGTFMENAKVTYTNSEGKEVTTGYAEILVEAARETNWSPFQIKTKIVQEVGSSGSGSVSGHYVATDGTVYDGYYNFFNYGAYDTGDAIQNALEYAKREDVNWNNPYKAIVEGAKLICNSYINAGQNTAYFFKFDVVGTSILETGKTQTVNANTMFAHQYMTNIEDPYNQSKGLYNTYVANGLISQKMNFIIPVYNNMPDVVKKPTTLTEQDGDLYYVNVKSTPLSIRQEPSYTANVVATIEKDEVVAMLEQACKVEGDAVWNKIKLEDGTVGYTTDEYITSCKNGSTHGFNITASSKEIVAAPEVTVSDIQAKQKGAVVKNTEGKTITGETLVGTGNTVTIDKTTYTIVKLGDVNGDGKVTVNDSLRILRYAAKEITLKGVYLKAVDANQDRKYNVKDSLRILNFKANISDILL